MVSGHMFGIRGKKSGHTESETTGTFWRVTVLETATRLRHTHFFDKNEQQCTQKALSAISQRSGMSIPPPLASDGHNGCGEAMVQVWGEVPPYKGYGPRPKHKQAKAGWSHLKVIKNRDEKKVSAFCEKKVVFGDPQIVNGLLGHGTVHVERTHLTMRNFNARVTRKGLGFSKKIENHMAAAAWEDAYYNFCHVVRTLRIPLFDGQHMELTPKYKQKWKHRTPMMATQITDHIWTVKELLKTILISKTTSTP